MDLLACSECGRRFYIPHLGPSEGRCCPQCGGGLRLALYRMASIPLDARWLEPRVAPQVTVVELRRKGGRAGKIAKRIVEELGDYFALSAKGRAVEVSVNRGAPADAALRVAAVLDGVDAGWEDHFYLPTADSQGAPGDLQRSAPRQRGHLRLIATNGDGIPSEGSA